MIVASWPSGGQHRASECPALEDTGERTEVATSCACHHCPLRCSTRFPNCTASPRSNVAVSTPSAWDSFRLLQGADIRLGRHQACAASGPVVLGTAHEDGNPPCSANLDVSDVGQALGAPLAMPAGEKVAALHQVSQLKSDRRMSAWLRTTRPRTAPRVQASCAGNQLRLRSRALLQSCGHPPDGTHTAGRPQIGEH